MNISKGTFSIRADELDAAMKLFESMAKDLVNAGFRARYAEDK